MAPKAKGAHVACGAIVEVAAPVAEVMNGQVVIATAASATVVIEPEASFPQSRPMIAFQITVVALPPVVH